MSAVMHLPASRGTPFVVVLDGVTIRGMKGAPAGVQRDPNAALGTFTLRLKNVVVGSRFRIERLASGSLAEPSANAEGTVPGVSGTTDHSITLNYYQTGNANNDLRVKVRKGTSAPKYQPFETQATAQSGTVDSFVAQVADSIA